MEHQKSVLEVIHTEKQLMALVYSKGILHDDFLELYRKIRTGYETILLRCTQMLELQEVEYHLWKLHYKLIDEFRKRIRQLSFKSENMKKDTVSENTDSQRKSDKNLEGFKSFLSEATEFYGDLIVKLNKSCGLPAAEGFLCKNGIGSVSVEPTKLQACQYTCHRLFICCGDLARYIEIIKKPDAREWSTAASYYIQATKTCRDSGNPHNQLALLATYTGDAFLALYHCVRSLAVKEPFPDAWSNLMLVLEENRSTQFQSHSSQMQIDFLNPSKRISSRNISTGENGSSDNEKLEDLHQVSPENFDLWPILVRTMSFFLIRSSLEEFPCVLATALHNLEALLSMDDTKLTEILESYKYTDSSKSGPHRAIQLVSMFIFIVHSLTENPETEESTENKDQQSSLISLAFSAIFICMGRLTERCLRENNTDTCPLSPAVMVFLEWLVGALDKAEANDSNERVRNAMTYFLRTLVDLLDRLDHKRSRISSDNTALWEDHELRGFYPLIHVHEMLDFTTHLECSDSFSSGNHSRCQRIYCAATRIMYKSKSFPDGISSNEVGIVFDSGKTEGGVAVSVSSPLQEEIECNSSPKNQTTTEDEEVILFKPITRRNSAPLYISKATDEQICPKILGTSDDEFLRRATSFSFGLNPEEVGSFSFCSTISNSGSNGSLKDSSAHLPGPPSLNAWVPGRVTQDVEREKGLKGFTKHKLSPIDEIASTSFSDLSVNETKDSNMTMDRISTTVHNSSSYVTPIPSAPLLPEDPVWLRGNSLMIPHFKNTIGNGADGILGAAPISGYPNRSTLRPPTGVSGLVDGYPPLLGMSSSEWLYHYRNSQNMGNTSPFHFSDPAFGNIPSNEVSSFDLCDQWGNRFVSNPMLYMGSSQFYPYSPLVYGSDHEQRKDRFFLDYQRPFPYVCGVGMEPSCSDQPQLLQYLKEKEWQLQPGSQVKGPSFMGN